MPEAIPWSVVIISLFLFLKILLFLVLYIAMETGMCYFYGHCYWFWIMIINIIFWTFTSSKWHSLCSPFDMCTCVKWCSGCRADANEAAVILLPSNITVFTLDFSGSGLSDGDYVSLGWHEVSYLFVNVFICSINYTNTTVFTLVFSGSGLSDGDYVILSLVGLK
jgi:hypothetical protein